MASDTLKVLGQSAPAASTLTAAYTVPVSTYTVVSTVRCVNRGSSPTTVRISVAVAGAADAVQQYLFYDEPIEAKGTMGCTEGWTLGPGDVLRVWSANGQVSFTAFGSERT